MRIDKFLKNSRIIKRRTIAKEACEQGRVIINEKLAKPGTEVNIGDVIKINLGNKEIKLEVMELLEHAPKDKAEDMYRLL